MWRWFERLGDETRAPRRVLQALADFADPGHRPPPPTQIPLDAFAWLGPGALSLLAPEPWFGTSSTTAGEDGPAWLEESGVGDVLAVGQQLVMGGDPRRSLAVSRSLADKLRTVDRIRPDAHSLRVGFLFVIGSQAVGASSRQRVMHPLVTRSVVVERQAPRLRPVGDLRPSPLIADPRDRARLIEEVELLGKRMVGGDGLPAIWSTSGDQFWLRQFATAAAASAGFVVGGVIDPAGATVGELLDRPVLDVVSHVGVYAVDEVRGPTWAPELRMWDDRRLRTWTGLHAMYLPERTTVRRGDPEPVVSAHRLTPAQRAVVDEVRRAEVTAVAGAPGTGKTQTIAAITADAVSSGRTVLVTARSEATVDALVALLDDAEGPDPVVFGGSERRAALTAMLEAGPLPAVDEDVMEERAAVLRAALLEAQRRAGALEHHLGAAPGGPATEQQWRDVLRLLTAVREACGSWMAADAIGPHRREPYEDVAMGALVSALRAPRDQMRMRIAAAWKRDLRRMLPLWIGTLRDVDELLPQVPALFDLVILDEANAIEQAEAAPALLRAANIVVVGDPRQLHHVSFTSHETVERVLRDRRITPVAHTAARLDVRSNSLLDVAAMVAPVHHLDEHFRSDPPLVEPVFDALYGGAVRMATRTPATEATSLVEVRPVDADPAGRGAVTAEVDEVLAELHRLRAAGERSVAVVSPFRAQVRAIERRVLAELSYEQIEGLDLRIGTVHGMQGNERDVVILSLGVGGDAGPRRWRFIDDPSLSAVMLTRARRRLVVVHGAPIPPRSLLARLTRPWVPPVRGSEPVDARAEVLAAALADRALPVEHAYPVGRHVIDMVVIDTVVIDTVVGGPEAFVGVFVSMHPDGVDAHIDRHLELLELGWTLLDVPAVAPEDAADVAVPGPGELAALADEIGARLALLRPSP